MSVANGVGVAVAVAVAVAVGVHVGVYGLVGEAVIVGNAVGSAGSDNIGAGVAVSGTGSGVGNSVGSTGTAASSSAAGWSVLVQAIKTAMVTIKTTNFSLSTFLFPFLIKMWSPSKFEHRLFTSLKQEDFQFKIFPTVPDVKY